MKYFLATVLLLLFYNSALACKCEESAAIAEAFREHDAIMQGEVIKKSIITLYDAMQKTTADTLKSSLQDGDRRLKLFNTILSIK